HKLDDSVAPAGKRSRQISISLFRRKIKCQLDHMTAEAFRKSLPAALLSVYDSLHGVRFTIADGRQLQAAPMRQKEHDAGLEPRQSTARVQDFLIEGSVQALI